MDRTEFINIADNNKNLFFRFALRLTLNKQDAEDIIQDTLLKVWQNRNAISTDKNFISYVLTSIRNVFIDSKRCKKSKLKFDNIAAHGINELPQNGKTIEATIEEKEIGLLINSIIDSLPEKLRIVMQLRDIEGYSTQDTADILRMDIGAVKMNLSRARRNVRHILQTQYNYTHEH